jgi:SAM-dependent methyltransferase
VAEHGATVAGILRRVRSARFRHQAGWSGAYAPETVWEGHAAELIEGYDHPETWPERGWMCEGVEEVYVPRLLRNHSIPSVLVVGSGTGRQYRYLAPLEIEIAGFDISPTLVAHARERYPMIPTVVDDVVGAESRHQQADAVLTSAVLQHVPPESIGRAIRSLKLLARRLIVMREICTQLVDATYQWAHDYQTLLDGWTCVYRIRTDATTRCTVDLTAWIPEMLE